MAQLPIMYTNYFFPDGL